MRRRLTLFDVVCIGINATVGSGVFALPDDIFRAMGGWSPIAYVLCTLLLLPVALCFAELASRHEHTGGSYLYVRNAFGNGTGYIVGWYCWANTFVSWAANTTLFVDLVGQRAGLSSPLLGKAAVLSFVIALGAINYIGVKPGAVLINVVVIGKLGAILCFVLWAMLHADATRLGGALPAGGRGVAQGVYLALFPLQGFEVTPITAGETQNPKRSIPLGTMGALVGSAALFVVVQAVLVTTHPDLGAVSDVPLVTGARAIAPALGLIVLIGSIVSIGGFTAGSALGAPRYAHAIAAHGLLPKRLASVHRRFGTPHVAIVVTTAATAVLAVLFDYRRLVGMSNVTVVFQYFFTCAAVPFLRRKMPATDGGWKVPGGWFIPIIGAAGSLALFSGAQRSEYVFAGVTLLIGIAVAVVSSNKGRAREPR